MKLKKGSAAAKAYMAKIRGMKKTAKPAKIAGQLIYDFVVTKHNASGKPMQQKRVKVRRSDLASARTYVRKKYPHSQGWFEELYSKEPAKKKAVGVVKKAAPKRKTSQNTHKDTRSHNVNIRVMSGIDNAIKEYQRQHRLLEEINRMKAIAQDNLARYQREKNQTKTNKHIFEDKIRSTRATIKRLNENSKITKNTLVRLKKAL